MSIFITNMKWMVIHKQRYVAIPKHKSIQINPVSRIVAVCGACNTIVVLDWVQLKHAHRQTPYYVFHQAPAIYTDFLSSRLSYVERP